MGMETSVLAPGSDERAQRADSLKPGEYSSPFFYKVGYSIVRLDGREKAREKTYDEAGSEVSSTYQDFESKRLETDWLDGLRKQYPVVENKEVLKDAFAPTK
jgi:parvulin-like peptidyl-prolyl isomerase